MAIVPVALGSAPTGAGGDNHRNAFEKVNANFALLGSMALADANDYLATSLLGAAALLNVGTTPGTVAAGDDPRFGVATSASVTSDRELSNADNNRMLLCSGDVVLTIPTGLATDTQLLVAQVGTGVVSFAPAGGVTLKPSTVTLDTTGSRAVAAATLLHAGGNAWYALTGEPTPQSFVVMLSDRDTSLTTGTARAVIRMPFPFFVLEARAFTRVAPTGAGIIVDVNAGGTSILSTRVTIDATARSSATASAQPVISAPLLADDAEVSFDIDQVGSTEPGRGLGVSLIGYPL